MEYALERACSMLQTDNLFLPLHCAVQHFIDTAILAYECGYNEQSIRHALQTSPSNNKFPNMVRAAEIFTFLLVL